MNQTKNKWDKQFSLTLPQGPGLGLSTGQVNYVPPSPQESKMAGQNEFIDLKRKRGNIPSCVVQPSDGLSHIAQSRTNQAKLVSQDPKIKHALEQTLQRIKLEPGLKVYTPHQAPVLGNLLPDPTLSNEGKQLKKVPVVSNDQPTKPFTEGLPLPLSEDDNADVFGVALRKDTCKAFDGGFNLKPEIPDNKYTPGTVKYTTSDALKDFINDLPKLHTKNTGCIVNETCAPEVDCYDKEIHFVSAQSLGRGSYGSVDLCYDSKTQKPFVRKQLPKSLLRTSEIIVPSTLNHHNITKFYGLVQRGGAEEGNPTMELLIEYGGHALNKYYQYGHRLTDAQKWEASKQGLTGLVHINKYGIVHLDIKPENICINVRIDGSLEIKLTDFGSSRLPQEQLKLVGLTPEYLAPEICKMFLQAQQRGLNFGLTEDDITGKVDTFAFGLVMMYLYKGYHILVKVINKGNTSYEGVDEHTRKVMHLHLMTLMADNRTEFVHNLIPDECDLDMRDLLKKLTRHKHQDRFSARQALDYIEGKEQRIRMVIKPEQRQKAVFHPLQRQVPTILDCNNIMEIPGIAEDCMESDNGPVKNKTKDALRNKLNPYNKTGKKGKKGLNSKTMQPQSPVNEMEELRQEIASKQMPMTPICEFQELSLGQSLQENLFKDEDSNSVSSMTEGNAPIAQPSTEATDPVIQLSQQPVQQSEFSAVRPTQQVQAEFNCIRPTVRPVAANNVVSLGRAKGAQYSISTQHPGICWNIPKEVLEQFYFKKIIEKMAATRQQTVQPTTPVQPEIPQRRNVNIAHNVQPEVINLDSVTDEGDQMPANAAINSKKTFGNSPLQMETDESDGPALPKFSML